MKLQTLVDNLMEEANSRKSQELEKDEKWERQIDTLKQVITMQENMNSANMSKNSLHSQQKSLNCDTFDNMVLVGQIDA